MNESDARLNTSGEANENQLQHPLWVVEGAIDFPTKLPSAPGGASPSTIFLNLGGEDPDGFVQLRHQEQDHRQTSEWWSEQEKWIFKSRALVRSPDPVSALMRGAELQEHVADRLTLWSGYPVKVISIGFTYNEDMLRRCLSGEVSEYEATTGGESTFKVSSPKNSHFTSLFNPPPIALEAIRWFRHAMLSKRILDQFLFYYISLESIAKHVPGVTRGPRRDSNGNVIDGLESQESAAIKFLLQRRDLPIVARKTLSEIRGRIAHGNTDWSTVTAAYNNMRAIQRLALDGLALVCRVPPESISAFEPNPIRIMAPILKATCSDMENPTIYWGGFLSDMHKLFIEDAIKGSEPPSI